MLRVMEQIPAGFLDCEAKDLLALLGGPTLMHLPGRVAEPLFVSVLLHGNEPTGLLAIQQLLRHYSDKKLPRSLSILVGNVSAAAEGLRRLDGQPDYNRVWVDDAACAESQMMQSVLAQMQQRQVFASIDIHNNTGLNPHYACVNRLDAPFLQLASMFGRTVVYFTKPEGVQSRAFSMLCPAVTLECGQPGQAHGVEHAFEYVDACLRLTEIPVHPVAAHDIDLFHTVAVVQIPEGTSYGFEQGHDLVLLPDIDRFNFSELPAGTCFGYVQGAGARLQCTGEQGEDLSTRFFSYEAGEIRLTKSVMPSMLTRDLRVIRQDCLCYLMERIGLAR